MIKSRTASNSKGFTLIELLLVIALLAISMGVTSDIFLTLIRGYNKSQIANEIEQQASFVALKLEKEVRDARNIAVLDSGITLQITKRDFSTLYYKVSSNVVRRDETSPPTTALTDNSAQGGVNVTCPGSVCFALLSSSPQTIRITMTFRSSGGASQTYFQGQVNIDNVIVIRDTY